MAGKECEHQYKMFKDSKLIGTGFLSFYCVKCLNLIKIKKEYKQ